MADLVPRERLQPSLLDRLVDKHPDKNVESRDEAELSMADLRRAVLRDLAWLFSAKAHTKDEEIYDFKMVAKSVVNFGIPDFSGETATSIESKRDVVRRGVLEAVRNFEPRIASHTLGVKVELQLSEQTLRALDIKISGDLWAQPSPEWLDIETTLSSDLRRSSLAKHLEEDRLHDQPPPPHSAPERGEG